MVYKKCHLEKAGNFKFLQRKKKEPEKKKSLEARIMEN